MKFEYIKDGTTIVSDYYEEGYLTKCYLENKNNEVVFLRCINKVTGEDTTHVFDNDNGEILTGDCIYFVKVTDLKENILVEENTRIYNCKPHTKVYGVCEDGKCKAQVLTYLQFPILEIGTRSRGKHIIEYPDGFNKNNTVVLAVQISVINKVKQLSFTDGDTLTLLDDGIELYFYGERSDVKVVLMKTEF